jgi:DNA-binding protein HU-beta
MTKAELIDVVAEKSGLMKKDSSKVVSAGLATITEALIQGDKISPDGFWHV